MTLFLGGTLAVAGATTINGEVEIQFLLLTNSFVNNGPFLFGSGEIEAAGSFDNAGDLEASNLVVSAATFTNTGNISTDNGTLSVAVLSGGFENLVDGVLTGGSYATSNGDIDLNVGGAITVDAANIEIGAGGSDIRTFDEATGAYVPIEQTLTSIAASGTLMVSGNDNFGNLSVSGDLVFYPFGADTISLTGLTVTSTGLVTSMSFRGVILGPVRNDGLIQATKADGSFTIGGALTGSGTIELAAAYSTYYGYGSTEIVGGRPRSASPVRLPTRFSSPTARARSTSSIRPRSPA